MPEARSWAMEVFDRWRLYRQVAAQQPIPNRELASLVLNRKDGMRKVRRIGMVLVTKSGGWYHALRGQQHLNNLLPPIRPHRHS